MEEFDLTQEKKELLIERITELLDENILKVSDWFAIYDVMQEACDRENALFLENYLLSCIDGDYAG